nr:MAG TPA: hypothetical protein [Myoviridae sp. ct3tv2]
MGACPSRSLARNAALTGAVFTCCPAIAAAPVPGCFRSPGTRHSVCRPRILSPDPAVSAAPARFFFLPLAGQDFFYPPCKKTLAFSN